MRICLVSIPFLDHSKVYLDLPSNMPLGLLFLGVCLEENGHTGSIVEINSSINNGKVGFNDDFYQNTSQIFKRHNPDVLGFSTTAYAYHHTLNMAKILNGGKSVKLNISVCRLSSQASGVFKSAI